MFSFQIAFIIIYDGYTCKKGERQVWLNYSSIVTMSYRNEKHVHVLNIITYP